MRTNSGNTGLGLDTTGDGKVATPRWKRDLAGSRTFPGLAVALILVLCTQVDTHEITRQDGKKIRINVHDEQVDRQPTPPNTSSFHFDARQFLMMTPVPDCTWQAERQREQEERLARQKEEQRAHIMRMQEERDRNLANELAAQAQGAYSGVYSRLQP